jgi:hypothetical protein
LLGVLLRPEGSSRVAPARRISTALKFSEGYRRHFNTEKATRWLAKSENHLFSISGAAEALGRTRRTITHALQGTKPDAIRSGLKLWSMKRIIAAVNANTQAPILTSVSNGGLQAMFDQLMTADDQMRTGLASRSPRLRQEDIAAAVA